MLPGISYHDSEHSHHILGHVDGHHTQLPDCSKHSQGPRRDRGDRASLKSGPEPNDKGYIRDRHDSNSDVAADSKLEQGQSTSEAKHMFRQRHVPRHLEIKGDISSHKYDHSLLVSGTGRHSDDKHVHSPQSHRRPRSTSEGSSPPKHTLPPLNIRPSGHLSDEADGKSLEHTLVGPPRDTPRGAVPPLAHPPSHRPSLEHDNDSKGTGRQHIRDGSRLEHSRDIAEPTGPLTPSPERGGRHLRRPLSPDISLGEDTVYAVAEAKGGSRGTQSVSKKGDSSPPVEPMLTVITKSGEESPGSPAPVIVCHRGGFNCFCPIESDAKHFPLCEERVESSSRRDHGLISEPYDDAESALHIVGA